MVLQSPGLHRVWEFRVQAATEALGFRALGFIWDYNVAPEVTEEIPMVSEINQQPGATK